MLPINQRELSEAASLIESAIATMEQNIWQKYYEHCLKQWEQLGTESNPDLKSRQFYQQEMQQAIIQMNQLSQKRITP